VKSFQVLSGSPSAISRKPTVLTVTIVWYRESTALRPRSV
jgi:hypothetical protein